MTTSRIRPWAAFGALAIIAGVAACSTTASNSDGDREGSDVLTIVLPEEPPSLEACESWTYSVSRVISGNVTESLTQRDPNSGQVLPGLATSWKLGSDGKAWTFDLEKDVVFHDGSPFNADAAAYGINRALNPKLNCGVLGNSFGDLQVKAKAVDEFTLEVNPGVVDLTLPQRLSMLDIPSPATPESEKASEPIGTGPYRLVEWKRGEYIQLERSSDYWGDPGPVARVRYVWRSDDSVRKDMIATGEADVALSAGVAAADEPNAKTYTTAETPFLRLDLSVPPLDDIRVRRAINMAMDRKGLIESLFGGLGEPASQIISKSVLGYNDDIPVWEYDPDGARALLDEAAADGVDVTQPLKIYGRVGLYPRSQEVVEAIQAMLGDVGLTVDVQMMEANAWLEVLLKPSPSDITQSSHGNSAGDAIFTVVNKFRSDGAESTVNDPKVDSLIDRASVLDGEERETVFKELMLYLHEEVVPVVPLLYAQGVILLGDGINYEPDSLTAELFRLSDVTLD